MPQSSDPSKLASWTEAVRVRVPSADAGSLFESGLSRIERADGIAAARIESVEAIDPRGNATILTLRVTISADTEAHRVSILETAPGVSRIETPSC